VIDFLLEVFVLKQDGINIPFVLILKFIIRGINLLLVLILLVLIKEQIGNFVINLLKRLINISVLLQIFPNLKISSLSWFGNWNSRTVFVREIQFKGCVRSFSSASGGILVTDARIVSGLGSVTTLT